MDIKEIVNSKGSKGAAAAAAAAAASGNAQDLQLLQSISQSTSLRMSEVGSERGNSPHDSEHSQYSVSRMGLNGMNGVPNGNMRYPSPPSMQGSLPMIQQPYRPEGGFDTGMMQQQESNRQRQPADGNVQKAFPCSSCGKGFARRSDLARHGKCHAMNYESLANTGQNEFTVEFGLMSVTTLDVANNSFNDLL